MLSFPRFSYLSILLGQGGIIKLVETVNKISVAYNEE